MPKPQEIFWEVGKELWKDKWLPGEFVKSPKFPVTDTCSLEIFFYPEGLGDDGRPLFKRVRSNTDEWMNIKGDVQFCHGITKARGYVLDDVFEKGEDFATYYYLEDIPTLSRFKIFLSLPDLCYRLIFTVSTDEAAYAKRSSKLTAESSDPNANSTEQSETSEPEVESVHPAESSEAEAADSVRQAESSDPNANSVQQPETSEPEVKIAHQSESSEPEAADSVQQTQSSEGRAAG